MALIMALISNLVLFGALAALGLLVGATAYHFVSKIAGAQSEHSVGHAAAFLGAAKA